METVKLWILHSFCSGMRKNGGGLLFCAPCNNILTCKMSGSGREKSNMTVARMRIKLGIKKVILFS